MKALTGITRIVYISFFVSHIIFTLLIDIQAILVSNYNEVIPNFMKDFLNFWITISYDPLMSTATATTVTTVTTGSSSTNYYIWFQSFIVCELLFQLPYFFIAIYYIYTKKNNALEGKQQQYYPSWFGPITIVYGVHTATTLIPILSTIAFANTIPTIYHRIGILCTYSIYFIIPFYIAYLAILDAIDTYNAVYAFQIINKQKIK